MTAAEAIGEAYIALFRAKQTEFTFSFLDDQPHPEEQLTAAYRTLSRLKIATEVLKDYIIEDTFTAAEAMIYTCQMESAAFKHKIHSFEKSILERIRNE